MSKLIDNDASLFGRIVTAMVTPFDEGGDVDYACVEKIVNHLIDNKTDTILVAGTTGESPTLSSSEKLSLLKKVIEVSGQRAKVIFGAGSNNTRASMESAKAAEQAGAQGLLVVAPYYNKPSQEGILAHIKAVSDATKLPVLVYNIPGRTGVNIEPATMAEMIKQCSQVKAIKDSAGNVDQTAQLASIVSGDADFRIYSGDDYLTLPMLSVGACGVVSVASHVVGSQIRSMIDFALSGQVDKARELHYRYLPVFKGLFVAPNPTCLKYFLHRMGLCTTALRLPLTPITDQDRAKMDSIMEELGLLSKSSI